jgi:hypothetical protein
MKHIFLLRQLFVITFIGLYFSSNAQLAVGLSGALNLAKQKYSSGTSFQLDYQFAPLLKSGILLEYRFLKRFSVVNALDYVQKGYKTDIELADITGAPIENSSAKGIFSYFENTTSLKYRFSDKKVRPYAIAGLSLSYLKSGNLKANNLKVEGIDYDNYKFPIDLSIYKRTDVSLNSGVGCEFQLKKNGLIFLEGQYQHGLTDILKGINTAHLYNRSIAISVGFVYVFVKKEKVLE